MAYVEQFHDLSTWREDNISVDPHEVGVLDLLDTAPNTFILINPNKALLKCAISTIPTADNYEFKVEYNCTEVLGRPTKTRKLYILNDSDIKATIKIFSVYKDFDASVLKNMNVNLKDYVMQTDTQIRGFADGVSLPSGTNNIGTVTINQNNLYNLLNKIGEEKKIEKTQYDNLMSYLGNVIDIKSRLTELLNPATVANKMNLFNLFNELSAIKQYSIDSKYILEQIYTNIQNGFMDKATNDITSVGIDTITIVPEENSFIVIKKLINDSENVVNIVQNGSTIWTLKAGESIENITIGNGSITISGGTFRLIYHL